MIRRLAAVAALSTLLLCGGTSAVIAPPPSAPAAAPIPTSSVYYVRYDHWSAADERGFGEFITSIGDSNCHSVDRCLRGPGNPYRAADSPNVYFGADCADLPYVLRFYYAWKRGLPFAYANQVEPRGYTRDMRYTARGNAVAGRMTVQSGDTTGYAMINRLREDISSATFRIHPELEEPVTQDLYSPALTPKSIRPGTVIYDPNGHLATVYRVDPDGRIHYIDAHPDNSVTRGVYDLRFVRASPGMGAGFKNWRPATLVGATRRSDGVLTGGHVELPRNKDIPDYSVEQFFGNGRRPAADAAWRLGVFRLNRETLDYYDYVRAQLAGGTLTFDPIKEVHDMVESNCADLQYRGDAVKVAIAAGIQNMAQPAALPSNIYGTEGVWEIYSTPSRDARLKTAFKELRDAVARFMALYQAGDRKLKYAGNALAVDMLTTYDRTAALCRVGYTRSDGTVIAFGYEQARLRLFAMSFDPYHCIERRWGAKEARELDSCTDGPAKRAWYVAEQYLRNQLERTYDVQMGFTLPALNAHIPGSGVATPPDTDVRTYLWLMRKVQRGAKQART